MKIKDADKTLFKNLKPKHENKTLFKNLKLKHAKSRNTKKMHQQKDLTIKKTQRGTQTITITSK